MPKQPEQPPPTKKPRLDTTPQASLQSGSDENDMSKWLDTLDFEIEKQKVGKSLYHVKKQVTHTECMELPC